LCCPESLVLKPFLRFSEVAFVILKINEPYLLTNTVDRSIILSTDTVDESMEEVEWFEYSKRKSVQGGLPMINVSELTLTYPSGKGVFASISPFRKEW